MEKPRPIELSLRFQEEDGDVKLGFTFSFPYNQEAINVGMDLNPIVVVLGFQLL